MKDLEGLDHPLIENGFGNTYLACLVAKLGADPDDMYCRGCWDEAWMDGDVLRFEVESAWDYPEDVINLLKEKFRGINIYWMASEPGLSVYKTNDAKGKYFSSRYLVDTEMDVEYFDTWSDCVKYVEDLTKQSITTMESAQEAAEDFNNREVNRYIYIYKYKIL